MRRCLATFCLLTGVATPMASVAQVATGDPHQPAVDAAARSAQESAVIRDQVEKGSEFVGPPNDRRDA